MISGDAGADDWLPEQTPQMLTDRLLQRLQAVDSGIIPLHDAQPQTAAARWCQPPGPSIHICQAMTTAL